MVKKIQKSTEDKKTGAHLSATVKDSAQQIWLAGLGAFAKAQEEGGRVFEALVKEGVSIQRKTQSAAEERLNEATHKMSSMASDITSKASGQWDKLENIFESRVAKALGKLGVPSAKDVEELAARVSTLEAALRSPATVSANAATRTQSAKPVAKKKAAAPRKRAAAKSEPGA